MITTVLATNKTEFQKYIEQLKVKGKRIFSPDEVEYIWLIAMASKPLNLNKKTRQTKSSSLSSPPGSTSVLNNQATQIITSFSIFARASSLPPNNSNIWNGMLQSASKRIMDGSMN